VKRVSSTTRTTRAIFWLSSNLAAMLAAMLLNPDLAYAQTRLPSANNPSLTFQTSGRERGPNVGDWYTTQSSASSDRVHRFFINITAADLAAAGGSITVFIDDAEVNGLLDEFNGNNFATSSGLTCSATDNCDPTRFRLLNPDGTIRGEQTIPGGATPSTPGTVITLPPITAPGVYQIVSETGAFPISGDPSFDLNNDDNGFVIRLSTPIEILIGQFQGTFQQNSGGTQSIPFFFLLGPGTDPLNLNLRNFDLDIGFNPGQTINYVSPQGATTNGTISDNGTWNNGGDLNTGQDTVSVPIGSRILDAGRWTINLNDYGNDNQSLLEVNANLARLPIFDTPPQTAGNFTVVDTGRRVNGRCVVLITNRFFTTDIINLQGDVLAADGNTPLPNTDAAVNDTRPDTGILAENGGAREVTILGTVQAFSFMQRKVSGTETAVPITCSAAPVATDPSAFRIVKRITNVVRNGSTLTGVGTNFGAVIDDPTDNNDTAPGFSQLPLAGITALPAANPVASNDEVTYTVYFLSDGGSPTIDANICDLIPGGMTFIPGSLELKIGSAPAVFASPSTNPGGNFFAPLVPLPNNNSCTIQENPNGAAIYELGTVSNNPGSNFGFVRFRVRVN
jgi:uncharacterized repeat protein (TIGR01451 family)